MSKQTGALLKKHILLASKVQNMISACQNVNRQFQISKCANVGGLVSPLRYDLSRTIQKFDDFRVCARNWLLGRMIHKLFLEFHHDVNSKCSGYTFYALCFVVYHAYTYKSIAPNFENEKKMHSALVSFTEAPLDVSNSLKNLVDWWFCQNMNIDTRQMDTRNVFSFTDIDQEIIHDALFKVDYAMRAYRKCMNQSKFWRYRSYRREIDHAKSLRHQIMAACMTYSAH